MFGEDDRFTAKLSDVVVNVRRNPKRDTYNVEVTSKALLPDRVNYIAQDMPDLKGFLREKLTREDFSMLNEKLTFRNIDNGETFDLVENSREYSDGFFQDKGFFK